MRTAVFSILLLGVYPCLQEGGFHPEHQNAIIERAGDYTLRLTGQGSSLRATLSRSGRLSQSVTLPSELAQVDKIEFVAAKKVAILGRLNGDASEVIVLGLDNFEIVDRFYCYAPILSPDKRLLAFIKFFPSHFVEGVSDIYLLYDFRESPAGNRSLGVNVGDVQNVGRIVYPPQLNDKTSDNTGKPESEIHMLESGALFWSPTGDRLVFADRYQGKISLVIANISRSGSKPTVKESEIKKSDVCLSSGTNECSFAVTSIEFHDHDQLNLKLRPYNPAVPVKAEITFSM
jgi:hypothetical protein